LKEAKDCVDRAPVAIVENVSRERAEEVAKILTDAGGTVEIK